MDEATRTRFVDLERRLSWMIANRADDLLRIADLEEAVVYAVKTSILNEDAIGQVSSGNPRHVAYKRVENRVEGKPEPGAAVNSEAACNRVCLRCGGEVTDTPGVMSYIVLLRAGRTVSISPADSTAYRCLDCGTVVVVSGKGINLRALALERGEVKGGL